MDVRFPFTVRVGQLMTGFGAGCGIGVGVGYPIAVGSIPVLGDVVRPITSAGSQAFAGVGSQAMDLVKKLGIKNLKAGIGCGVGIGHGFGAGLALKPGVVQQLTHTVQKMLTGLRSRLQKQLASTEVESNRASISMRPSNVSDDVIVANKPAEAAPAMVTGYAASDLSSPSVTTKAVHSTSRESNVEEDLRYENHMLRTLLRHQELIEDLREENAAIRQMLNEQIDFQAVGNLVNLNRKLSAGRKYRGDPMCSITKACVTCSCKDCFDCRRRFRRRRRL